MIRDNTHDDLVTRVALSGLEAKIMTIMTENSRLRTTVNRQTTALSALQARLEELEDNGNNSGTGGRKSGNKTDKSKEKDVGAAAEEKIEKLEARVRALEKSLTSQRARTRGKSSASAAVASGSLSKSLHCADSSNSSLRSSTSCLSKSLHSNSDVVYRSKAAAAAAGHASSPTPRMTKARMNRMAGKAAVTAVIDEDETQGSLQILEESLTISKAFLEFDDQSFVQANTNTSVTNNTYDKDSFPFFSAERPSTKPEPPVSTPESPTRKSSKSSSKSEGRRKSRRASMASCSSHTSTSYTPNSPTLSTPSRSSSSTITRVNQKELYQPFTPEDFADAQAGDAKLCRYLENPAKEPLYPKFVMSVVNHNDEEDQKIILFRKRVYVPQQLREATMLHYYQLNHKDDDWACVMCKHKIWPTVDADITDFVRRGTLLDCWTQLHRKDYREKAAEKALVV